MVNIIKKNKELFILIGILLAIAICVEAPSWIKGGYFIGGGDIKTQWYPFYVLNRRETIDSIKSGSLPFYSWILFLGNNIWASKTSYGLFDIFNIIFYFCRNNYFWIYDFQIIIKLLVAGITFYLYIDNVFNNKKAGLLAGVLYSSSSFLLYFTSQSGFLSFVALAPLYLLGIEHHIKENKNLLFIISTFILLLTNYYLFYSLTIFSPFYYLYRYYNYYKKLTGVFKEILKMIFLYFVGVLMSAVVILPTFFYIIQSERVGEVIKSPFLYNDIRMYLHLLCSMFIPNDLYIYGNNVFDFNEHTLKEICMFSSCLVSIIIPQLFKSKNNYFKKSTLYMYFVFIIILFIPFISYVMNGFGAECFRWTYIIIIFNIYLTCYLFYEERILSKNTSLKIVLSEFLIIFVCFVLSIIALKSSIKDYYIQLLIIVVTAGFSCLYSLFINNNKIIIFILVVEITTHSLLFGVKNTFNSVTKQDYEAVTTVLSDEYSAPIKEYLNSLDLEDTSNLFRTYVSYESLYWEFSRNMNLLYKLEGLMTYDSTIEPSYSDLKKISKKGVICDISWEVSITDQDLLDFLSCKYALTVSEEEIPFKEYEIIDREYRGGIIISKNLNYEPICVSYTEVSSDDPHSFSILKEKIITKDDSIKDYIKAEKQSAIQNVNYFGNHLDGTIKSDEKGFAILKLSYDDGFRIKVNNKEVPIFKCNGGVIGFPIEKGVNIINIDFIPVNFKMGAYLSIIGFVIFIGIFILQIKKTNQ